MNTLMKRALLLSALAILFSNLAEAQSWQWGKRGGSADNMTGYAPNETVIDMATDLNGNVYTISTVGKTALNVDGHSKTASSRYGDILISSFSCDGSFRWSKIIGGPIGDVSIAIKTDALGGVYVSGRVVSISSYGHCQVDADTTLAYTNQNILLVKYDTAGNYQWLRMPEPDTVSLAYRSVPVDVAVDPAGTCYLLCYLYPGSFANGGFVNTSMSVQILKYNANGQFLGNTALPITASLTQINSMKLTRDNRSGKYYIQGGYLTLNGTTFTNNLLCAFSATGSFLWAKQVTGNMGFVGRIALGNKGLLFATGYGYTGDSFNGFTVPAGATEGAPIIVAIDTNGNRKWATAAKVAGGASGHAVAANGNEVAIIGHYPGRLKWPGAMDSLNHPFNTMSDVFITRFNASTGAYIKQDTIGSPSGYDDFPSDIISDNNGNYFVGGQFSTQFNVPNDTLISNGGETDFFVAKYGLPCGCTSAPISNFSFGYSGKVVQFTYNGSTVQADSIVWSFGDGQKQTIKSGFTAPIMHTYSAGGTYNVCATVYAYCGTATSCKNVTATGAGAVGALSALGNIKVYPNPANQFLTIEGAEGATAVLVNSIGQRAMQFSISADKQLVDISALPFGMYILQLTDAKGNRGAMTVVKQ